MFQIKPRPARCAAGGFTLIEALVVLAIASIVLAVGIPAMNGWMMSNKAASAGEFYMEGFRLARQQAISHNAASRIVLSANQTTGQMDWQVDICFPLPGTPCTSTSSNWSTPTSTAKNDPDSSAPFTSLRRSADILPSSSVIAPTLLPVNAYAIYYNALGWVDTSFSNRLVRLQLDPLPAYVAQLPTMAISITLAGMPTRCNVTGATAGDSRACPLVNP